MPSCFRTTYDAHKLGCREKGDAGTWRWKRPLPAVKLLVAEHLLEQSDDDACGHQYHAHREEPLACSFTKFVHDLHPLGNVNGMTTPAMSAVTPYVARFLENPWRKNAQIYAITNSGKDLYVQGHSD